MAKWKREERARFEDMPQRLVEASEDAAKRERAEWLEEHGLTLVDFMSWRRAQDPTVQQRPPARRKLMTPKQLAEFDRQREQEGDPKW
jgi:hypothetical protein